MMKVLVEMVGHSGLGKSSLAYSLAGRMKLMGLKCELHTESIKGDIVLGKVIDAGVCRSNDTSVVRSLAKIYDYVVSDTNSFSGFIFGDTTLEESLLEARKRWEPFDRVEMIFLFPDSSNFSIPKGARFEKEVDTRWVENSESLLNFLSSSNPDRGRLKIRSYTLLEHLDEIAARGIQYDVLKSVLYR